jgi:hypothetical protein
LAKRRDNQLHVIQGNWRFGRAEVLSDNSDRVVVEVRNRASYGGRCACRQSKTEQAGDSERGCEGSRARVRFEGWFHFFVEGSLLNALIARFTILFRELVDEVCESLPELENS